jgi:hypothetical protein
VLARLGHQRFFNLEDLNAEDSRLRTEAVVAGSLHASGGESGKVARYCAAALFAGPTYFDWQYSGRSRMH